MCVRATHSVNLIEIGFLRPANAERPWRVAAGTLSDTELRLATLSVGWVTAARIDRLNQGGVLRS
jgi:hypothetical protein